MSSKITYCTLFNYSPRGKSEKSVSSRNLCGAVKAGRPKIIENAVNHLNQDEAENLKSFFDENATLVPVPRSSPLVSDATWPSKVIADALHEAGFGKEVNPLISRTKAIPKSSSQTTAASRPSVKDHVDSLLVDLDLSNPTQIILVDDVLTLGRTTFACAQKLSEVYPKAEIKIFSLIRTKGLVPDIEKMFDPSMGTISYNEKSGKTSRNP